MYRLFKEIVKQVLHKLQDKEGPFDLQIKQGHQKWLGEQSPLKLLLQVKPNIIFRNC